jgi:hypothetical protein
MGPVREEPRQDCDGTQRARLRPLVKLLIRPVTLRPGRGRPPRADKSRQRHPRASQTWGHTRDGRPQPSTIRLRCRSSQSGVAERGGRARELFPVRLRPRCRAGREHAQLAGASPVDEVDEVPDRDAGLEGVAEPVTAADDAAVAASDPHPDDDVTTVLAVEVSRACAANEYVRGWFSRGKSPVPTVIVESCIGPAGEG